MNTLVHSPVILHLGWTLIHFLWQGMAVGLIYLCLRKLLRQHSPQTRYVLALIALLTLVLLPLFTFFYMSGWAAPHLQSPATAHHNFITVTAAPAQTALPEILIAWISSLSAWAVILWLMGVVFMGARAIWGWHQISKLWRSLPSSHTHPWQPLAHALSKRMHIKRAAQLLASARVHAPMVVGWLKPVILIPPSAVCGLSWQQAEMILAHELAHIRRCDYLFNLFQAVVETLLFYHPVVHWISRDARNEREFCCDDAVMDICSDRAVYLKALAELECLRLRSPFVLASNGGSLLSRAYRLACRPEPARRLPSWFAILLAGTGILAAVTFIQPHGKVKAPHLFNSTVIPQARISGYHVSAIKSRQIAAQIDDTFAAPTLAHTVLLPPPVIITQSVSPLSISSPMQPMLLTASLPPPAPVAIPVAPDPPLPGISVVATQPLAEPRYPYQVLRDGQDGTVQASFRVSETGDATDIRTKMLKGPVILASAARQALENWKFDPVRFDGRTVSPQVNLVFAFTTNPAGKPADCVMVTGSHVCRRYRITVQNVQVQQSYAEAVQTSLTDRGNQARSGGIMVKLADGKDEHALVCRPQDPCFLAKNQPFDGPAHRQHIENQLRMLSEGLIPGD